MAARKNNKKEIAPKKPRNPWGEDEQISTTDTYLFRTRATWYNPDELVGKKGLKIYDQIRKDEQVKAALTAANYAVLATGYEVELPEVEEGSEELGEELKDFVTWNFEEMQGHFDSKILNLLEARIYGFAWAELVYRLIDYGDFNGKVGLRDLKFRRPFDVYFDVDEHGDMLPDGILQGQNRLPVEKFVLYAYRKTYDNPYGESDLREAYRAWWKKDIFSRFESITLERYGEPIWVFTHSGRLGQPQRTKLENFIKNLQSKTGIVIPDFIKAEVKQPPPRTADAFIPAIQQEDAEIRMSLLLPGLMGLSAESETGSFARSQTEFDVFLWIVQRIRQDVETAVNEQVVKRVIDLNYEVTGGQYPTFKFNTITEEFKHKIFGLWTQAISAKSLSKTREDENKARDLIGFPELPEEISVLGEAMTVEEKEEMKERQKQGDPFGGLFGGEGENNADDEKNKDRRRLFQRRTLTRYERRVDFAAIERIYNRDAVSADLSMRGLLKEALKNAEEDAERLVGSPAFDPRSVLSFRIDVGPKVAALLRDYLVAVWRKARDGALKELPSKVRTPARTKVERFQVSSGFEPEEALRFFDARSLFVKGLLDEALTRQAKAILFEHLKGGRTTIETIKDLRRIFEPYVGDPSKITPSGPGRPSREKILEAFRLENIVRTETTTALNQGRLAVGDASNDYVIGYEFSAILDERTTEVCQTADGLLIRRDDPRLKTLTPNLHYQCRSVLVFVTQDDVPISWSSDAKINAAVELVFEGFK